MYINLVDLIFTPFVLLLILYLSLLTQNKHIATRPEYKYYMKGIVVKLFGGLSVCFIYSYYYQGGDTVGYFHDSLCMTNLAFKNFPAFMNVMENGITRENYHFFDKDVGYPYYYKDTATFIVVRIAVPFVFLSFKSFLVTTLFFAWVSYAGVWRLYTVFVDEFPEISKELALAFLFIPSVFFWGSGLLKDTITFSALGFYIHAFYKLLIRKNIRVSYILALYLSAMVILAIKPYIFFALLPGSLLWLVGTMVKSFKAVIIRFFITPLLIFSAIFFAYLALVSLGDSLGTYAIDTVLERAVIVNQDLKQDYYKGNSFDIGDFDANVSSMLSKAPQAIAATLFRPYIWEANNIVMFASAIENTLMLFLTIYLIFTVRFFKFLKIVFTHHLLVFSLIFSLFFAFAIGISTSNFGSLVRYKIPVLPLYVASLLIIKHYDRKQKLSEEELM